MRTKKSRKKLAVTLSVIFLVVLLAVGFIIMQKNKPAVVTTTDTSQKETQTTQIEEPKKPLRTRFVAAGDSIGHDALNKAAKNGSIYSYAPFMDQLKPLLKSADIAFCNQSTLVGGEKFAITGYPSFNSPAAFATDMAETGCNLVNTASNHSSDKSQAVIDANVDIWAGVPNMLAVAGQYKSEADKQKVSTFEVDGLTYAFLAYSTFSNSPPPTSYGVAMYSRQLAAQQIAAAKTAGAKFIIVSMRWGTEYSQGINAYQQAESQYLADLGVAVVLGHGPHVLEPVKRLTGASGNETVVWYSLGNFLHAQLEPETLFNGVAVMEIDPATASVTSISFLPTYMHYEWTAAEAARQDLLARKNFDLVPLESARTLLEKSLIASSEPAQKERLKQTLNAYLPIPFTTYKELGL